jgi:hypothetical protein
MIIGAREDVIVLSPGAKVYVEKIQEGDGVFWNVYRDGKTLIDPVTKEILGVEAIYLGDAKVTHYGRPASAEVVRAVEEIFKGDKLIAATDLPASNFVPRAPDGQITGHILSVYGGVAEAGVNSIVSLNRGNRDGLETGHVLAIYREGQVVRKTDEQIEAIEHEMEEFKNNESPVLESNSEAAKALNDEAFDYRVTKLPDERVGLLMIFRTFDKVSYGLIMQASEQVNVLDLVKTP